MPLIGRGNIDEAISDLVQGTNDKLTSIVSKGLVDVVVITPTHFKDGGRLQGAWNLSIDSPDESSGNGKGAGHSLASIAKMPNFILGKVIYFTNPMPYANIVEYGGYPNPPESGTWTGEKYEKLSSGGYSRQAPSGMARTNINKMQSKIKAL